MPSQLTSERLLDAIAAEGALASTASIFGLSEGTIVTLLQVELPLLARLTGTNPELLRRLFAVSSIPLPVSSRQFYSRMVENPAVRQSAIDDFRVTFGGMVDVATREAARRVTGQPRLPIQPFPYPMIYALSPFVEMFRELLEMRYLWRKPVGLSNAKLVAFLGEEPHTPLDAAVRATLSDMGCLEEVAAPIGARAVAA